MGLDVVGWERHRANEDRGQVEKGIYRGKRQLAGWVDECRAGSDLAPAEELDDDLDNARPVIELATNTAQPAAEPAARPAAKNPGDKLFAPNVARDIRTMSQEEVIRFFSEQKLGSMIAHVAENKWNGLALASLTFAELARLQAQQWRPTGRRFGVEFTPL